MSNDMNTPIDFNKLAAYLDGCLAPEEMAAMESIVSSDPRLSKMMNDIDEIDLSIIENLCSDDLISDTQLLNITLPEIETPVLSQDFFDSTDSLEDLASSIFTDSPFFLEDGIDDPSIEMDDIDFNDL